MADKYLPIDANHHNHISYSIKLLEDIGQIVPSVMVLFKGRGIWKAFTLVPEIEEILLDAKNVLPELASLNSEDAKLLTAAAYECIKKILAVV